MSHDIEAVKRIANDQSLGIETRTAAFRCLLLLDASNSAAELAIQLASPTRYLVTGNSGTVYRLDEKQLHELRELIRAAKYINCIKMLREFTGATVADAKGIVDNRLSGVRLEGER